METEQITKINTDEESNNSQVKKQKDPKKVAAGKALARKNAEARKLRHATPLKQDEELPTLNVSTIYNGIQNIAVLVTSGFTLYHGWKFYESYRKPTPKSTTPESTTPESTTPESTTPESTKKSLRKSVEF